MASNNQYNTTHHQLYATLEELEWLQVLVQLLEMPSYGSNQPSTTTFHSNTPTKDYCSKVSCPKPNTVESVKKEKRSEFKEQVASAMAHHMEVNPNFIPRKCTKYSPKSTPYDRMKKDFLLQ